MRRRIAIGVAWWLAVAYAWQVMANIYGFAPIGPLAGIVVAVLVAATLPQPRSRPMDRREIYRPPEGAGSAGADPITLPHGS